MPSKYILVTGSAHADIGKGTVAATLGRARALAGERVAYVKIDPCLQGPIDAMGDDVFGEIIRTPEGVALDADVARAAFLIPGFVPTGDAQRSLGRAMHGALTGWHAANVPAPRMLDGLASLAAFDGADVVVVEVGGTAGEVEHELVMEALARHAGAPELHVHVTAVLRAVDGRATTKPAQVGIRRLCITPHVVLVRGPLDADGGLRAVLPQAARVVALRECNDAPEAAAWEALKAAGVIPPCEHEWRPFGDSSPIGEVCVMGGGPPTRYLNLTWRLRLWSKGRLRVRFGEPRATSLGLVLVGEEGGATHGRELPTLDLRVAPGAARDPKWRLDWRGTLDAPDGGLASWVESILQNAPGAHGEDPTHASPYAVEAFALRYKAASGRSALRDHGVLNERVWRTMGDVRGRRILDLGCGTGRWSAPLVDAGATGVGVEPAAPMADAAAERHLERFRLVRTSAEAYVPDGVFDGVLASMSLDHVADVERVFARIVPSLSPGAWVIVTTEHPLRTAPQDGVRWVAEAGGRSARVRDYGRPGWRRLSWFDRPEPVWAYHRSLSDWVAVLRNTGLSLVDLFEPVADDPRDAGNPRFWLLVARLNR